MTALISFGNNLHLSNLGRLFSVFSFASEKLQNEKEGSLFWEERVHRQKETNAKRMSWKLDFWKLSKFFSISFKQQNIFLIKKAHYSQVYLFCWTGTYIKKAFLFFCQISQLIQGTGVFTDTNFYLLPTLPSNYSFFF